MSCCYRFSRHHVCSREIYTVFTSNFSDVEFSRIISVILAENVCTKKAWQNSYLLALGSLKFRGNRCHTRQCSLATQAVCDLRLPLHLNMTCWCCTSPGSFVPRFLSRLAHQLSPWSTREEWSLSTIAAGDKALLPCTALWPLPFGTFLLPFFALLLLVASL